MNLAACPLPDWPYPVTKPRREPHFRTTYDQTLALLEREIRLLGGHDVVVGAGFQEWEIRRDGMPAARAREPGHPGVEVSFDSKFGRQVYHCDACHRWRDNVRSIALGLEALRAVDRYGISARGEQYAGWVALPPGRSLEDRGRDLVVRFGSVPEALKRTHPDHGGDANDLPAVLAYRENLDGAA